MNDLDITSIFLSLLKDERNVIVRNPISPPNSIVDSSSSSNNYDTQVLEEEADLLTAYFTRQRIYFTGQRSIIGAWKYSKYGWFIKFKESGSGN